MFRQSFSVGGQNEIHLHFEHGGGDVHLLATDETYLRVQGEGEAGEYKADWQNGTLTMNVHADAAFFVPRSMDVRISGNFGDLDASGLGRALTVEGGQGDVNLSIIGGAVGLHDVMGDLRASRVGSLSVEGTVHGDATILETNGEVNVGAVQGDLQVDDVATLHIGGDVSGTTKVSDVQGEVTLHVVRGDLVVRDTGAFGAEEVNGDVRASHVDGDLRLASINGDAKIESIAGRLVVESISGDARLVNIEGGAPSLTAGGDLYMQTTLDPEQTYEYSAGGDLVLALPGDAAAKFECNAGGEIYNRFDRNASAEQHWTGEIGQGGPSVRLHAGGDILIKPQEGEHVEFRVEINREEMKRAQEEIKRARAEMKRIKHEMREQLRDQKHQWKNKFREEDIERKIHESLGESFRHHGPRPPRPPRPPRGPGFSWSSFGTNWPFSRSSQEPASGRTEVSDEERMAILKMLEEKKITAEQAEMLLKALGDQ